MNAREFGRILWRRKLVCVIVALLVVAGGFGFLATQKKVYQSSSSIALLPVSTNPDTLPVYANIVTNLIPTYQQLIISQSFLAGVAATLPFPTNSQQLQKQVHPEVVANAGIIKIVAELPSPTEARDVARNTTQAFLSAPSISGNGVVALKVFDQPRVPDSPIAPRPKLVIGAAIAVAVVLGIIAGLVWERLFGRVFDAAELADASELPVIGVIPDERGLRERLRVVVGQDGLSRVEESIRALRTNFVFAISGGKLRSVVITSLGPSEGKTTIAVNLAVVIAELGLQVVLVDGDIHRPRLHEVFGIDNQAGLTSTLHNGIKPASLMQAVPEVPNLQVVTAGPPLGGRGDEVNLYLQHVPGFIGLGDIVIVDSPPLRAGADVRLLATSTGAVLLAVKAGTSTPRQIHSAVDGLSALNAKVIGSVLTRAKEGSGIGEAVPYYSGYRKPEEPPAPTASAASL